MRVTGAYHWIRRQVMSNPFLPAGYRFLPDGYLRLVQAAALLAFGDLDYLKHLTEDVSSPRGKGQVSTVPKEAPEIGAAISRLFLEGTAARR